MADVTARSLQYEYKAVSTKCLRNIYTKNTEVKVVLVALIYACVTKAN